MTPEQIAHFEERGRYDYPLNADSVVMDLGGYLGDFAARIHEQHGCRVVVFEPVPEFFAISHNRLSGKGIRVINMAVGGETKDVEGFMRGDSSSIHARGDDADRGKWSAKMITIDRALEIVGEPVVDLIKINIEGEEFSLLEDMVKKGMRTSFGNIQIQWHDMVPDAAARYSALQVELAKTHELTFDNGWTWQSWKFK